MSGFDLSSFRHEQQASRVVFGAGELHSIGAETRRVGVERAMLISDGAAESIAATAAEELGGSIVLHWTEVIQHVPADLAGRARAVATEHEIDGVVTVGGGSATGLAKAIALSHRVPIVAVPTTYAGSEQTPIYGVTGAAATSEHGRVGRKETGRDPVVQPRVVIYDPELTATLPPHVTGPSAFNALAHSVEALYAPGCNPVTSVLALEAVRAINRALPAVLADGADLDARAELLYGAYLSGVALGDTSAAFHHKICHVLGGTFDLVHADAHSVVLPHALAFNAPAIPAEAARLAVALDSDDGNAAGALWDLATRSGVPTRLADLSGADGPLQRDDLELAAKRVVADVEAAGLTNPRPFGEGDVRAVLEQAFDGERPARDRSPQPNQWGKS